ncbi:MAG: sigma-70 family RNA polymerase sigma factor [Anaerolineaceae bacterium]|nr:sigma-70 family RNA polymerase sigma factor [Anaerolineaceae bacterium]
MIDQWLVLEDKTVAVEAVNSPESFLVLYDRYFTKVYNYVRYRCVDPHVADDLTSQAFMKALSKIETYHPEKAPFEAWLFAIVRNLVNDLFRQRSRHHWVELEVVENVAFSHPRALEDSAEKREEKQHLLKAMEKIPSRQRDLIALKFAGEMTNREIASLTGLTEQNVGVILHRGLKKLRKYFEEEKS